MLKALVTLFAFTGTALATNGTFRLPLAKPVFQVELLTLLPYNVTTPSGTIAAVPNRGGTVKGAFNGEIVGNLTAATEIVLPSEDGEYTHYENQLVIQNKKEERIFLTLTGTITYANNALHGFGHANIQTTIPGLEWMNYGMFVGEWMADFFTGTGQADVFEIKTGGRLDGKPIPALLPPGKVGKC